MGAYGTWNWGREKKERRRRMGWAGGVRVNFVCLCGLFRVFCSQKNYIFICSFSLDTWLVCGIIYIVKQGGVCYVGSARWFLFVGSVAWGTGTVCFACGLLGGFSWLFVFPASLFPGVRRWFVFPRPVVWPWVRSCAAVGRGARSSGLAVCLAFRSCSTSRSSSRPACAGLR